MVYPEGHRENVRARIVVSARRLFNQYGFERVSVNQIMAGAGLTRGGFYSYFRSKSDLYVEVLGCFFTDPTWKNHWEGVKVDLRATDASAQVVRAYLSKQHFEDIENSCPMVALPCDITRGGARAREAFEKVFHAMVRVLENGMSGQAQDCRAKARAIAALCVGGMVVARAMENRRKADELRTDCMKCAMKIGGW
jgi:TetR/AcrR family transcriptional regulator, transcriptional repressor for nem operon